MTAKKQTANETPPWGAAEPVVPPLEAEEVNSPFAPVVSDNPFLKPPAPEAEPEPELHEAPEGTPTWNTFVGFILRFGDVIQRGEYPTPRGEVVDTIWQGVPVVDGPKARVRHKHAGWVDWEVAVKGTDFQA